MSSPLTKDILLDDNLDLVLNKTTDEIKNIEQHIITRLLVQKGELQLTPNFGSRLNEKVGIEEIIDEIINTLNEEPRIEDLGEYKIRVTGKRLEIDFEKIKCKVNIEIPF